VRDNLADCLVTLPALLDQPDHASLHFWFANFDGMRRELFPRLAAAYEKVSHGDTPLHEVVAAGRDHWAEAARRVLALDETSVAVIAATPGLIAL